MPTPKCSQCQQVTTTNSKFCTNCGASLTAYRTPAAQQTPPPQAKPAPAQAPHPQTPPPQGETHPEASVKDTAYPQTQPRPAPRYDNYPNIAKGNQKQTLLILLIVGGILLLLVIAGGILFALNRNPDDGKKRADSTSVVSEEEDEEMSEEDDEEKVTIDESAYSQLNKFIADNYVDCGDATKTERHGISGTHRFCKREVERDFRYTVDITKLALSRNQLLALASSYEVRCESASGGEYLTIFGQHFSLQVWNYYDYRDNTDPAADAEYDDPEYTARLNQLMQEEYQALQDADIEVEILDVCA